MDPNFEPEGPGPINHPNKTENRYIQNNLAPLYMIYYIVIDIDYGYYSLFGILSTDFECHDLIISSINYKHR